MKLFVIQSADGNFYRPGPGRNWVSAIDRAKFYTKIGYAKTALSGTYSSPPPNILEFDLSIMEPTVHVGAKIVAEANYKKVKKAAERSERMSAYVAAQKIADELRRKL
jgi:hypothetical protein